MLRLPQTKCAAAGVLVLAALATAQTPASGHLETVRFWSFGDVTRIAVQTQGGYKLASDQIDNPFRLYFDFAGLRPPASVHRGIQTITVNDHRVKQIRIAEVNPGKTRIVFDLEGPVQVISSQLVNPDRLMIELRPKGTAVPGLSIARSVTGSQHLDAPVPDPPPSENGNRQSASSRGSSGRARTDSRR